jgi:hypothetical protein
MLKVRRCRRTMQRGHALHLHLQRVNVRSGAMRMRSLNAQHQKPETSSPAAVYPPHPSRARQQRPRGFVYSRMSSLTRPAEAKGVRSAPPIVVCDALGNASPAPS